MEEQQYSIKRISPTLVLEFKKALKRIESHGSVEIFVQSGIVTQITVRNIKKTSHNGTNGIKQKTTLRV